MLSGKLAWFRFCIRYKTEPTKNAMVPFLVPFRTGIMVPKVDQLFVHFLIELINSSWSRKTAKSLINCCGVYLCDSGMSEAGAAGKCYEHYLVERVVSYNKWKPTKGNDGCRRGPKKKRGKCARSRKRKLNKAQW